MLNRTAPRSVMGESSAASWVLEDRGHLRLAPPVGGLMPHNRVSDSQLHNRGLHMRFFRLALLELGHGAV